MSSYNILLVSHGLIAEGLYRAAKMIVGDLPSLYYLNLDESKGIAQFKDELKVIISKLKEDKLIILSDLDGGSPYNSCVEMLDEYKIYSTSYLISGMNLPLLLQILENDSIDDDIVNNILDESKNNIKLFKIASSFEEDDEL